MTSVFKINTITNIFKKTVINLSDTEPLGSSELLQVGSEDYYAQPDVKRPPGKWVASPERMVSLGVHLSFATLYYFIVVLSPNFMHVF